MDSRKPEDFLRRDQKDTGLKHNIGFKKFRPNEMKKYSVGKILWLKGLDSTIVTGQPRRVRSDYKFANHETHKGKSGHLSSRLPACNSSTSLLGSKMASSGC